MSNKEKGYVYILTNPSFREDWVKIGKSSRPVDIRSKELDNTAVPLPFEIFATMETDKYNEVEKLVHKTIDRLTDLRIRQNREFFNVAPQIALDIFRDIALTIDDAIVLDIIFLNFFNSGCSISISSHFFPSYMPNDFSLNSFSVMSSHNSISTSSVMLSANNGSATPIETFIDGLKPCENAIFKSVRARALKKVFCQSKCEKYFKISVFVNLILYL